MADITTLMEDETIACLGRMSAASELADLVLKFDDSDVIDDVTNLAIKLAVDRYREARQHHREGQRAAQAASKLIPFPAPAGAEDGPLLPSTERSAPALRIITGEDQ